MRHNHEGLEYLTIKDGFITVLIFIGVSVGVVLLLTPTMPGHDITAHGYLMLLPIYILPMGITYLIVKKNLPGYTPKVESMSVWLLPSIVALYICFVLLITPVMIHIPEEWQFNTTFLEEMMKDFSVPVFLTMAVAAPILEEFLFRGVLLEGLLRRYNPYKAIAWSAFFFGFIHFNIPQFIAGFVSGFIMGYLYERTRSVTPGIVLHFLNNVVSYLVAVNAGEAGHVDEVLKSNFPLLSLMFAAGAAGIYLCYRVLEKQLLPQQVRP